MTGSPFSNVVGSTPGSSSFKDVEATQTSDTTAASPSSVDSGTEPAGGLTPDPSTPGAQREAGQNETAGDTSSN